MERQSLGRTIARVCGLVLLIGLPPALFGHGGVSTWRAPAEAQKVKNPVKAAAESIAKGKELYAKVCSVCHGEKGDGKGPAAAGPTPPPANFTDKKMMDAQTDGELFWKLTNGDGDDMASYKNDYSKTDRWNLVNYLRTFASAPPAKAEQGKVTYTCPMHPEVTSDKPGKCPQCGMNLVPKKLPPPQMQKMEPGHMEHMENMPHMEHMEHMGQMEHGGTAEKQP